MAFVVVPLGAEEIGDLSLAEWDELTAARTVLFEDESHPLRARLDATGTVTGTWDGASTQDGQAVVVDPGSPHIVDLAKRGARVTAGTASPPDSLSAAHAAPVARRAASALGTVAVVMARLRSDDGCPWDREQSHESLQVHLLEEAHEVLDAIDRGAIGAELEDELGDLLLQVAFHARLAAQEGRFDFADVGRGLVAKLVHRHPHVFADVDVADAAEVVRNWETIKSEGRERSGAFDDIPRHLSALLAAWKTQKRAAALGFNPSTDEARAKLAGELEEVASGDAEERLGDLLFWAVAAARALGVDPEGALRRATLRFRSTLELPGPLASPGSDDPS